MFKKLRNILLFTVLLIGLFGVQSVNAQTTAVCGEWIDVDKSDQDYTAFVTSCNLGFFKGNSEGRLYPDKQLTRAETAVILNRVLGLTDEYDPKKNNITFIDDFFIDNLNEEDKQWIFRAVYRIQKAGIFNGYPDGTFKPLDKINFAEFAKVVLLTIDSSDRTYVNFNSLNFDTDPWYEGQLSFLTNLNGYGALIKETEKSYRINTTLSTTSVGPSTVLTRRQAMLFLHTLASKGYLYGLVPFESEEFSFMYPAGMITKDLGDTVQAKPTEALMAQSGLQRVLAGNLNIDFGAIKSSGVVNLRLMPEWAEDFGFYESCDSKLGSCQTAYFFDTKYGTLYLEGSYLSEKSLVAREVLEDMLLEFELK